jgi:hypothetical protein
MLSYHNFFLKSNTFACDFHWILDPPFERDEAFLACKINKKLRFESQRIGFESPRKLILCVLFFPHLRQGIHLMAFPLNIKGFEFLMEFHHITNNWFYVKIQTKLVTCDGSTHMLFITLDFSGKSGYSN